jgi:hypothetical protein
VRAELAREGLVTGAGLAHLPVDRKLSITGIVLIRQPPRCHMVRCAGKLQREKSVIHIIVDHLDDMPPPLNTLRDRSGDPRAAGVVETALRIHR